MKDPAGSPYLVKGDQWIGYDTVPFILDKMEYVKSRGLGGAMVWAVGLDDIRGVCGPKRPLLTAINQGLGRLPTVSPVIEEETTPSPIDSTTTQSVIVTEAPTTAPPPLPVTTATPPPAVVPTTPITEAPTTAPPVMTTTPTPPIPIVPSSTPASAQLPATPFTCSSDGYFVDPNNCGRFYRCHNSVAYGFDCPASLYFDVRYSVCNWPFLVDCSTKTRISAPAPATNKGKN